MIRAHRVLARLCARAALGAGLAGALWLMACAPRHIVLEETHGIVVTLRDERDPPRDPPGPDFAALDETALERSLSRVIVRYGVVVVFNRSDPVPLFSAGQRAAILAVLLRELPRLPGDKRLGLTFNDAYLNYLVDVEIYPAGNWLVYDFRALQQRIGYMARGERPINMGVLFPQRDQVANDGRSPLLKDPIASAARPDLRLPDDDEEKEQRPASPL